MNKQHLLILTRLFASLVLCISFSIPAWANNSLRGIDPVKMVLIPSGHFLMGNPQGHGRFDEQPQRKIFIDSFEIDQVEVSNKRYLDFIKSSKRKEPPNPYGTSRLSETKGINHLPVVQVTWYDAVDYCRWAGKRLPTEAEWEKAARGEQGSRFPWGHSIPTTLNANFDIDWNGTETLYPVGTRESNQSPYGVFDMAGNVREWVSDWYDPYYYSNSPEHNPKGPDTGVLKGIRGGSWHSFKSDLRGAARGKGGFALKTDGIGFRCARDIQNK